MAGFVARLDEINALAERSPGFVWRLQTSKGNATYFRPYPEDDRILINMSVWETIESLPSLCLPDSPRRTSSPATGVVREVCWVVYGSLVGSCWPSSRHG
jgi:hypothetical protein